MKIFHSFASFMRNVLPTLAPKDSPILTGNPTATTPPQFDNDTSIATTAFVQRALGNYRASVGILPGHILTPADVGGAFSFFGQGAVSLPLAGAVPSGAAVTILSETGESFEVLTQGGDVGTVAFPYRVVAKESVTFVSNGVSFWTLISGGRTSATPPQFDKDSSVATTEFVQRALGNYRATNSITNTFTLTALHAGLLHQCTGAGNYVVTLPLASTVPTGGTISLISTPELVTVGRQGTDVILASGNSGSIASMQMKSGDTLCLVSDGSGVWSVAGGSANLQYADGIFGANKAANGYQKLPSGVIIQWGLVASNAGGVTNITFPIPFPTNFMSITGSNSIGTARIVSFLNASKTSVLAHQWDTSGALVAENFSWVALGY